MVFRTMAIGLVAGACLISGAEAATISIVPGSQNATVGTPVDIDIVVSGLGAGESVGGVALTVSFSNVLLDGVAFELDPDDNMATAGDPIFDLASGFAGGSNSPFEASFLAGFTLDNAALKALQGDSFILATVTFNPLQNGLALLTIAGIPGSSLLSDALGDALIGSQATGGEICIGGNCARVVPEPATLALVGLGMGALVARGRALRRRRGASSPV